MGILTFFLGLLLLLLEAYRFSNPLSLNSRRIPKKQIVKPTANTAPLLKIAAAITRTAPIPSILSELDTLMPRNSNSMFLYRNLSFKAIQFGIKLRQAIQFDAFPHFVLECSGSLGRAFAILQAHRSPITASTPAQSTPKASWGAGVRAFTLHTDSMEFLCSPDYQVNFSTLRALRARPEESVELDR